MSRARRTSCVERRRVEEPRPSTPAEEELARARRLKRRGDARKALVALRHAAALDDWSARAHALLGAALAAAGHVDEAMRAFGRARWLRARAGELGRERATARLLDGLRAAAA